MTTFNDIFTSSFLENVASFSFLDMAIALVLAFVLGLFIFIIYKKTYSGVMYSSGFGLSLVAMAMITALVILAVSSNVVLSLGMVGALSIVRFRSAVKDPMDIAYMFWAIAVGIVLGAGMIPLAVLGSVCVGLVLILFSVRKPVDRRYILVVDCDADAAEEEVSAIVREGVSKQVLKSKTVSEKGIELTMEVRLREQSSEFLNQVNRVQGVSNAVMVSYNGEYLS
ncbi:MAG: DUF4956 domain-containing protein [Bacillota bacterium]|nr:DUF4956 domain-containing protein [Bacillota bacterium]